MSADADESECGPNSAFVCSAHPPPQPGRLSGDIVVSIANTDSSPSSLLEAMASGNPLVGGWCPSIDEWIGPGEGAEMVQPRDEEALAAALDRLLADGALRERYAERNLRIVRERVAESAPAMEALYRRLISEHAERSTRPVS